MSTLTGCTKSEGSHAAILTIEDCQYYWQGDLEENEFTVGQKLGEVTQKVEIEILPEANFSSNFLEVGEEIYTTIEDNRVLLLKITFDGNYDIFTQSDYYKDK